jgi:hypothetical protein
MNAPFHPMAANDVAATTIVESGCYRTIVSEHPDHGRVYLAIENGRGGVSMFADPVAALQIAKALIAAAGKGLEVQFRQQLGSS